MKKVLKIIGVLLVVLIVATVALLVAVKILITPERVRQVVVPRAEEQLGRPVSIGDINVRIFKGIVISDFVVGSKDGTTDFVSAESLILRYRFLPLLRRSVIIEEARLTSPAIRIERYEDGTFNFSDLLEMDEKPEPPPEPVEEPDEAFPIDLLVEEITISRGSLFFVDHLVDQTYQLTDLNLSVTDFSLERSFPFALSARLNNAPIALDGSADLDVVAVTASLRVEGLDVAAFMPYAADDFPGKLSSMKVSMDIRADATEQAVKTSGRISVHDIGLLLDEMPDVPIEKASVSLDYDIAVDLVSEKVRIIKADTNVNGIMLSASGNVSSYATEPILEIVARLPMISLSDVIAAVPQNLVAPLLEMRPSGRIGAQFQVAGTLEQPAELIEQGEITLETIRLNAQGLPVSLNGGISVVKDSASAVNLVLTIAEDPVQINFTADNLMGEIIRVTHTTTAQNLDIDRIRALLEEPEDAPEETYEDAVVEEPGPFDLPLDVTGDVRIANAVLQGLAVKDFDLRYYLRENVLSVDRLKWKMAGGTVSGNAEVELNRKPIAYIADISIQETRLESIVNALVPAISDTVFGTMNLKADIKGEGTGLDVIRETITSHADIKLTGGRLSGGEISSGLVALFNSRDLEVLKFDSWSGKMAVKQGNIELTSRFEGNDLRMAPTGNIGLNGALSLSLDLRLSPDIAQDLIGGDRLLQFAPKTDDGWTMIPIKIGGTLGSPDVKLDADAFDLRERGREELRKLREQKEEEIRKQLKDNLLDRLSIQDGEKADEKTVKEEARKIERKVEDRVRRLLD